MSINLLIVEDDLEAREKYKELLGKYLTIDLVGEATTQSEAWNILQNSYIDAMILDLELPSGSGILLLEEINTSNLTKPFIVIVTHICSKTIFDVLRNLGADYICVKNDTNFSYDTPIAIIEIATPYIMNTTKDKKILDKWNKNVLRKSYEKRIHKEFSIFGFPEKLQGTIYCKEAVLYLIMNDCKTVSLTKDVYADIASKHFTNKENVERSIRNAIEKVWLEQPLSKLKELYPYAWDDKVGRPTNGNFIKNIRQKIIRQ